MSPRQIGYDESLENYYRYILDYLHQKYDNHSCPPVHMSEARIAELNYFEAQARHLIAEYERQRADLDRIIIGHVDR